MNGWRVLDLFSGIGGFSLGLQRAGMHTVAFCEIDPFCRRVLNKHWPNVPIYPDIRELTGDRLSADGIIPNVICGGFPCQDLSVASSTRTGLDGERSGLWSEYARVIREVRPRYVIVENSSALIFKWLGRILGDLAALGFDAEWHCLRASTFGAPFEGDRIYILAEANASDGQAWVGVLQKCTAGQVLRASEEYRNSVWLETARRSARMGHGFSDYVDRRERTEVLGNAVVPQIPELIGRAIIASAQHD